MITYNLVKYKHRYNNDPAPFTNKKSCLGEHCKIGRMNLSLETTISSFPRFAGGTVQHLGLVLLHHTCLERYTS